MDVSPYPVEVRVAGNTVTLFSEQDLHHIISKNGVVRVFTVEHSSYQQNLEAMIIEQMMQRDLH